MVKKVSYIDWKPEEHEWNKQQISELEEEFEKLPYKCIIEIANKFEVYLDTKNIERTEKSSLLWTIISDGVKYDSMKSEINNHKIECLKLNNS